MGYLITIPDMKSKYIPVTSFSKNMDSYWWEKENEFFYPYTLINLDTTNKEGLEKHNITKDTFLLTDSGGFQVMRGICDLNWVSSLTKQIDLNATKIFSFDIPPVKRKNDSRNTFIPFEDKKIREIIEKNIDVALLQRDFLKENHPEYLNRFCYVLQATKKQDLDFNIQKLDEKIGMKNFSKSFPGGISYSMKTSDILNYGFALQHAKDNFIKKNIYVHFLGMGSFYKMLLIIKNGIDTFDSSNAHRAYRWEFYNPTRLCDIGNYFVTSSKDFMFSHNFCFCPTCRKIDMVEMGKNNPSKLGVILSKHNLWHILKMCYFLNSIRKDKYTEIAKEIFRLSDNVKQTLEMMDYADEYGLDTAYNKYKFKVQIEKQHTKQTNVFGF